MKARLFILAAVLGLAGLIALIVRWQAAPPTIEATISLGEALSDGKGEFARVTPGRVFQFPQDFGEHPAFKTEWWYFTGNLESASGDAYGYQLTFFRSGLPKPLGSPSGSAWSADQVMMAHFALSDPSGAQKFSSFERFSRRALGLAGVEQSENGLKVWLEDWRLTRVAGRPGRWTLEAAEKLPDGSPLRLNLHLTESKPPVLQGENGYSLKGPKPEDASYYVSLTRLASTGTLQLGERRLQVRGDSWFDHEWSSAALAPGLVGWDWFSLQLDDGSELMLYQLRYADGRLEPASSGALVAADGSKRRLALSDFSVDVKAHHDSPRGVKYPSRWTVRVPSAGLELDVEPRLADQEMASGVPYWEGAVTFAGQRGGRPVGGSGFVEMTGYAEGP